jgi:hypothetical protein
VYFVGLVSVIGRIRDVSDCAKLKFSPNGDYAKLDQENVWETSLHYVVKTDIKKMVFFLQKLLYIITFIVFKHN